MAGSPEEIAAEPARLATLQATGLLDTPPEEEFDRFTRLAARLVRAPIALVSLVDERRQFFKSAIGIGERETPLSHSFCKHVVADRAPLVVSDARRHPLLHSNLAIRDLGVVAYLGMPLATTDGHALGSFCAIDTAARDWSPEEVECMRELAALVMERIELRLAAKELQESYLALRTAEMQRDELVHMLVHDLRNPLSSIIMGMHELVRSARLTDQEAALGRIALEGGDSLLEMVNTILEVSKAEATAGGLALDLAEVSPAAIATTACAQLAQLAGGRGVQLEREFAAAPAVQADGEKIRRLLVNLIANAIQHTLRGGRVTVRVAPDGDGARFVISDSGCGIAPEAFGRIFQKYGQTGGRRIKGVRSTGLGLAFSRMAVEAHGGSITVESELGHGTTFTVALPARPPRAG